MDRRALERLGHHVVSRRVALGFRTRIDLADSVQFTVRTLSDIEHGVRKASPGTYAMLEKKLAWAPGSIDTILAGGEPTEVASTLHKSIPDSGGVHIGTPTYGKRLELRRLDTDGHRRTPCLDLGVKWSQVQILSARP